MNDQESTDSQQKTIADVAKQADVSSITVSRVLSDGKVPPKERAKVQQAMQELDYRQDSSAQAAQSPQIFLSYSRADWQEFTLPLLRRLESEDLLVWVDQYAIRGGDDWLDGINLGLEQCRLLVLCVSPESLNSRYVKMEYRYFLEEEKPVIPVICKETKLPAELRGIQYLPYAQLDKVVRQVRDILAEQQPA
jgi:hypothetical protein